MKPRRLTITNFRAFKGEQSLIFPDGPGLFFMQGRNEVDQDLEGNGAGKSTIWEALTWLLFGKTSEGLKAGELAHWSVNGGMRVSLELDSDLAITRTWKPNSWTLQDGGDTYDLTKEEGNPILHELRVDFLPYLQAVLLAQGTPMFLDLKAEAQASLFSEVLGLERWTELSAKAAMRARDQDGISRVLEAKVAGLRGRLDELGSDFEADIKRWDEEHDRILTDLEHRAEQVEQNHAQEVKRLNSSLVEHDRLRSKIDAINQQIEQKQAQLPKRREAVDSLTETIRDLEHRHSVQLRSFDDYHEGVCPRCNQRVDHDPQSLKLIERELKMIKEALREATDKRTARLQVLGVLEAEIKALEGDRQDLVDAARDLHAQILRTRQSIVSMERELVDVEDRHHDERSKQNPFKAAKRKEAERRRELVAELDEAQRDLDASYSRYELLSFWVKGFKEVRLQQIAGALHELELEANSELVALGLSGWSLEFDVDRETKGGSLSRGFSVRVVAPHTDKPVAWGSWSGGERQRLRLAAQMGLGNLIRGRMGMGLPLEVWDEPSRGLSPKGIQDLLAALEARALAEDRQIWIVDHTAHSFGGFAGRVLIRKTRNGSIIEQEQNG